MQDQSYRNHFALSFGLTFVLLPTGSIMYTMDTTSQKSGNIL